VLIIIDANVLVEDPARKDPIWRELESAIARGTIVLAVPQIAVAEAVATRNRTYENTAATMLTLASGDLLDVDQHLEAASAAYLKARLEDTESRLASLREVGVVILSTPEIDHDQVAARAMNRRRPFKSTGDGYRDTLHWLAVVEQCGLHPRESIYWVSNDGAFGDGSRSDELHPDLLEDLSQTGFSGTMTWVRSLRGVVIPEDSAVAPVPESIEIMRQLADWLTEKNFSSWHAVDALKVGLPELWPVEVRPIAMLTLITSPERMTSLGTFTVTFQTTWNSEVHVGVASWLVETFAKNKGEPNLLAFVFEGTVSFHQATGAFSDLRVTEVAPSPTWTSLADTVS